MSSPYASNIEASVTAPSHRQHNKQNHDSDNCSIDAPIATRHDDPQPQTQPQTDPRAAPPLSTTQPTLVNHPQKRATYHHTTATRIAPIPPANTISPPTEHRKPSKRHRGEPSPTTSPGCAPSRPWASYVQRRKIVGEVGDVAGNRCQRRRRAPRARFSAAFRGRVEMLRTAAIFLSRCASPPQTRKLPPVSRSRCRAWSRSSSPA
jgi:hypothetical protein